MSYESRDWFEPLFDRPRTAMARFRAAFHPSPYGWNFVLLPVHSSNEKTIYIERWWYRVWIPLLLGAIFSFAPVIGMLGKNSQGQKRDVADYVGMVVFSTLGGGIVLSSVIVGSCRRKLSILPDKIEIVTSVLGFTLGRTEAPRESACILVQYARSGLEGSSGVGPGSAPFRSAWFVTIRTNDRRMALAARDDQDEAMSLGRSIAKTHSLKLVEDRPLYFKA